MGDPKAFLNIPRHEAGYRPVHERITDFSEVEQTLNTSDRKLQASRCMDCLPRATSRSLPDASARHSVRSRAY